MGGGAGTCCSFDLTGGGGASTEKSALTNCLDGWGCDGGLGGGGAEGGGGGGAGGNGGGSGVFFDWDKFEGGGPEGKDADEEDAAEGGRGWGIAGAFWGFWCVSDAAGASPVDASDLADDDALFLYILLYPPSHSILFNAFEFWSIAIKTSSHYLASKCK